MNMEQRHSGRNSFTFIINNFEQNQKKGFHGTRVFKRSYSNSNYNFNKTECIQNQWTTEDNSLKNIPNKKTQNSFIRTRTGSFTDTTGTELFQNVNVNSKKHSNREKYTKNYENNVSEGMQHNLFENYTVHKQNANSVFFENRKCYKKNFNSPILHSSLKINSNRSFNDFRNAKALNDQNTTYKRKKKRKNYNYGKYDFPNKIKYENASDIPNYKDQSILNSSESSGNEKRITNLFSIDIGKNNIDKSVISLKRKPVTDKSFIENTNEGDCLRVSDNKLIKNIRNRSKSETDIDRNIIKENRDETAFHKNAFDCDSCNSHKVKKKRKKKKNVDNLNETGKLNITGTSVELEADQKSQYLKSEEIIVLSNEDKEVDINLKKQKKKKRLNPIIHISESDCEIIDYVSSNIQPDSSEESCSNTPKKKLKHKAKIVTNNLQKTIPMSDNNTRNISKLNVQNEFKTKKKKHPENIHHKNKKYANSKKNKHNNSNNSSYLEEESSKEYTNFESLEKDLCSDTSSDCSKIFDLAFEDSSECGSIVKSPKPKKGNKKNKIDDSGMSITRFEDGCKIIDYVNVSSNSKKRKKHNSIEPEIHTKKKHKLIKHKSFQLGKEHPGDNNHDNILNEERSPDVAEITHENKDSSHRSHIFYDSDSSEIISDWKYRKTNKEIQTDNNMNPLKCLNKSNMSTPVTSRTNLNSTNEGPHQSGLDETESIIFEDNVLNKLENESQILEEINSSYLKKEDILEEDSSEFNNFEFVEDQRSDISEKSPKSKRNKKSKINNSDASTNISEDNSKKKNECNDSTDDILNTSKETSCKDSISRSDKPLQIENCVLDYVKKPKKLKKVCNKQNSFTLDLVKEDNCQEDDLENHSNILQEKCLNNKDKITLGSRHNPVLIKNEPDLIVHDEIEVTNFTKNTIDDPNNLDNEPKSPEQKKKSAAEKRKDQDKPVAILDEQCELIDNINSSKKKKRKRLSSVEIDEQCTPTKKRKIIEMNGKKESPRGENDVEECVSVKPKKKKRKSSQIGDKAEVGIVLDSLNTEELIKDKYQNTELENCDISSENCLLYDTDETTYKSNKSSDIGNTTNETDLISTNETRYKMEHRGIIASGDKKKKGPIRRRSSVFAELMENKSKTIKSENQPIVPEISTDPDDIEDDIEKLKDLTILFPFNIPPLHALPHRTSILKKAELEKIKEMNLSIKTGFFTKEEDDMIIENWERLCKDHGLRMNPDIFIKFPKRLKMEKKLNILRYIAHGLDDRPIHRVYARFKILIQKTKLKTGRFTPEEDRILFEFVAETDSDHPFSDLAKLLNRTSCSVEKHYKRLTSNRKVTHWNPEMVDRLVKALLKITKCEKVKQLKRRKFTPEEWRKLSKKLDNIPIVKLQRAWNVTIYPRLFSKEVDRSEIKEELIHILCERNERNWKTVNWKEIAKYFKGCTPQQIYAIFRQLTYFHVPQDKHSDLKECLRFLKHNVLRYDVISTAHKLKKFVFKNGQVTYDSDSD